MTSRCLNPRCQRPSDLHLCNGCWGDLRALLENMPDLMADITVNLAKLSKLGGASIGYFTRGEEIQTPLSLGTMTITEDLRGKMASWVRDLWERNSTDRWEECEDCETTWSHGDKSHVDPDCQGEWVVNAPAVGVDNTVPALSSWLLRHPTWVRLHPAADDLFAELTEAIGDLHRIVDRSTGKRWVGNCQYEEKDELCDTPLYAEDGDRMVRCRTCGCEWDVAQMRSWWVYRAEVKKPMTPVQLSSIFAAAGVRVTPAQIRAFAARNRITSKGDNARGHPTYLIADVRSALEDRYRRRPA